MTIINYDNLPKELATELAHAVLDEDLLPRGLADLDFDLTDYGMRLGNWHNGQGDPVYAVGSCARLGVPHPQRTSVVGALTNLESELGVGRNLPDDVVAELTQLVQETGELLAKVYPPFVWNGDKYGTASEAISDLQEIAVRSISETAGLTVTRGGRKFRVVLAVELREIE